MTLFEATSKVENQQAPLKRAKSVMQAASEEFESPAERLRMLQLPK